MRSVHNCLKVRLYDLHDSESHEQTKADFAPRADLDSAKDEYEKGREKVVGNNRYNWRRDC